MHLRRTRTLIAVLLAAVLAMPAFAVKTPPPATMGPVTVVGNLVSGGSIHYQFDLNAVAPGSLFVKATVKSKKSKNNKGFNVTVPTLSTTPAAGTNTVTGPTISVPSNFVGTATLKLQAKFNGKKVGNVKVVFTIAATPPPPTNPPPTVVNLFDVGFENQVTLDGSAVPTTGLGAGLTYAWTQTNGKATVLSATNVAAPTFTTDAATNFVNMGTAIFVNDIDDNGFTNALYVAPEHRFGTVSGLALDNEQATAATYTFRLLVSDGSITRTGTWTVACATQTPAHPNIPIGVPSFYKGATNSTNWALLAKPAGSTATLIHTNGLIAELRPDVEGVYILQDNVTGKSLTNTAASWTGVQFCAVCHGPNNNVNEADMFTPWSKTLHATMAQRGVDGVLGSHYSEACFQCHTVGFNQSPAANNGNFFAVQQQVGWAFPSVLKAGNFAAMPTALQAKANIQCENCHGPGSRHPGSPSLTLDERVCASCHQDGTHHVRPEQWEISPHAGAYENVSLNEGTRHDCARCHSAVGFTALGKGEVNLADTNSIPIGVGPLTCQTCHNPHDKYDNPDRHQLRVWDSALLGNPYFRSNTVTMALGDNLTTANLALTNSNLVVTNLGASAACIVCHNGRQLPTQVQLYGSNAGKKFYQTGGPHDQTAGEAFLGVGAYDYGQTMGASPHTFFATCQSCHMYLLRAPVNGVAQDSLAINGVVTNVTTALYNQYVNVLGDHTFKLNYQFVDVNGTNDVENLAACNQCHASFDNVDSFDFKSALNRDYDGNGTVEGIQTETHGLLSNLSTLIYATGVKDTISNGRISQFGGGYSTNSVTLAEAQRKAVWNWFVENREGSYGVHNTQFTIRLLQTSYTDLKTNSTGNAADTFQSVFPNAYLR